VSRPLPSEFFELVRRETGNRQYYRPIHSVHKWWARRPGSLFRGLLLDHLLPDGESAWERYHTSVDIPAETGTDPIILDPFMGGGTTLIEAVRLGVRAVGVDLSPVAWWTVRQELLAVPLEQLDHAYDLVRRACAVNLRALYATRCPCGARAEGVYWFWVTVVPCARCGSEVRLHRSYRLATAHRTGKEVLHCPRCGEVFEHAPNQPALCVRCGERFDPDDGPATRARYTCTACDYSGQILDALDTSKPPAHHLYAVEYNCPRHGRGFKKADRDDVERVACLDREAECRASELLVPPDPVPEGYNAAQMQRYGYRYFRELFNSRQLLALDMLAGAINDLPRTRARDLLVTLFSDILDYNCIFCGYNKRNRQITNMFSHHAYIPQKEPVENNVWGSRAFGGGNFSAYFRKLRRAKQYNLEPFEKRLQPGGRGLDELPVQGERVDARLGREFGNLRVRRDEESRFPVPVLLLAQSAEDLPLPDNSVDGIFTDPPYFDNVMYGELAEFYYVWLKLLLGGEYPEFSGPGTERDREAVKDPRGPRRTDHYQAVLRNVFRECRRVLKPEAPLVCTFHHGTQEAWVALLGSLLGSGFALESFFGVQSEMDSSVHIMNRDSLVRDVVLTWRSVPHKTSTDLENGRLQDQLAELVRAHWVSSEQGPLAFLEAVRQQFGA